jgi:hypothetical protein
MAQLFQHHVQLTGLYRAHRKLAQKETVGRDVLALDQPGSIYRTGIHDAGTADAKGVEVCLHLLDSLSRNAAGSVNTGFRVEQNTPRWVSVTYQDEVRSIVVRPIRVGSP